ncbi:helix-turn-helix domain-containing protein [Sediminivirga luteola]|uniref:helix-turn-helix domain-containing protein n=1 Tax=Sediminivirga luteola TaxID=1774748 RepID=UPI001F55F18B|nr:XRE family transcriptional regulator [Sediminivirga luteola]MCI2266974.1 XRE family transcriptional regulator [Sediminivirga luteola]
MDKRTLGARIALARELTGMTQEVLGRAVGLDRTAITRLEKGERKLNVSELVAISAALDRPLAYFVEDPVQSVVSRRRGSGVTHRTTDVMDAELQSFAADARVLLDLGLLDAVKRSHLGTLRDHDTAERQAEKIRRAAGLGSGPVRDLLAVSEGLGMMVFIAELGSGDPDGACVEVTSEANTLGAAVINGAMPSGRRRMTVAHELGHWLSGDAYDTEASLESEKLLNSFAVHFLAPRSGVIAVWDKDRTLGVRDRALVVAAEFRLSWSAAVGQLKNLGLLTNEQHRVLAEEEPRAGDYRRLRLSWQEEAAAPALSAGFAAACVNGYVDGRLTEARTLELLRGTLSRDELPRREPVSDEILRRAFAGHDG